MTTLRKFLSTRVPLGLALAVLAAASITVGVLRTGPTLEPLPDATAEAGLSVEAPPGTIVAQSPVEAAERTEAAQQAAIDTTAGPDDPQDVQAPLATAEQPGCTSKPVRNFSSRHGARPALLVAHYTVSENRDGWGDVDAIVHFFDDARAQASSNYVIDFEGHCAFLVSELSKAWTQGFFNPWSVSIEFIATGRERVWPDPGLERGARVFAAAAKRWGIPIRPAVVSGCKIVRSGILDHDALGCGNTHTDVRPFFPMSKFIRLVKQAAGPAAPKPPPAPGKPYRVCSTTPKGKRVCRPVKDVGAAVTRRFRLHHTDVKVTLQR